jgi:hypothetical protein
MDLCSNEILLADNIIPEHLSGCINCCGRWSCSSSLVPIPGFFFSTGRPAHLFIQKAARGELFPAAYFSNN